MPGQVKDALVGRLFCPRRPGRLVVRGREERGREGLGREGLGRPMVVVVAGEAQGAVEVVAPAGAAPAGAAPAVVGLGAVAPAGVVVVALALAALAVGHAITRWSTRSSAR